MIETRWIKTGMRRDAFMVRLPGVVITWWITGAPFWLIERGYPSLISANLGRLHIRLLPDYRTRHQ